MGSATARRGLVPYYVGATLGHAAGDAAGQQIVLVGEVVIDDRLADAGVPRDVFEPDAAIAVAFEQLERRGHEDARTIVGAPLGLGVLLGFLPLLAFVGFLVAGIFIGEEILGTRKEPEAQHPYRAALLGIVLLQIVGLVPVVGGLATAVASLLGLGAIVLIGWRIVRGTGQTAAPQGAPVAIGA